MSLRLLAAFYAGAFFAILLLLPLCTCAHVARAPGGLQQRAPLRPPAAAATQCTSGVRALKLYPTPCHGRSDRRPLIPESRDPSGCP